MPQGNFRGTVHTVALADTVVHSRFSLRVCRMNKSKPSVSFEGFFLSAAELVSLNFT